MPLYGSVKPIYLYPGQQLALFDGTESRRHWREVRSVRASTELRRASVLDGSSL